MTNLLAAGERAGVQHQVILSIVNVDQVPQLVYYRGQGTAGGPASAGPTPYSIVRATQFFEFMDALLASSLMTRPSACRLPAFSPWRPRTSPGRSPKSPSALR